MLFGVSSAWAGEKWIKTAPTDLATGDIVVLVDLTSGKAMSNDKGTANAPSAVEVTLNNDNTEITSNVGDNLQWTITATGSGDSRTYQLSTGDDYAYVTKNNNGVRVGSGERNTFTITTGGDNSGYYLYNEVTGEDADKRYIGCYNKSDWRCYTSINNNIKVNNNVFFKKEITATPQVETPIFTPQGGTYEGAQNVTISTTTNEATIYYTTDGTDPTTNSDIYSSAITVSSTTTIKAIATKDSYDNSSVATASYIIIPLQTISEVRAQAEGNVNTKGIVTSVNGKTAYIQDNTAAIAVYDKDNNLSVAVGDEIKVSGALVSFNELLEISTPTITVVSTGNTVAPVVKTIEEINTDYSGNKALQGMLVKIVEATVTAKTGSTTTNATIKQGENTIEVRGIGKDVEYEVNDKLTLVGNIGCYNAAQIANPTNVEVVKNEKPAIGAEDVTIEFDATSGEIEYTVDNPTSATLTATLTPGISWISNINVTADKVTFTAEANEGAERTATITLSYTNAEDKVVTITQKKYGIASVPFAFYGGVNDITTTYGLTQEGLGSDYGSNAPKLKFDTGDDKSKDNLILRINDAAKVLSFDIKGNSFSGGTFDVLTSADGETYTQLASYTELTSTVLHESFILNNDVRYIKWIYTNKQNGNVGLGNIKVFSNESVAIPVSKYTTFVSTANIDFSGTGVTAYTAEVNGNAAKLSAISGNIVPANTGVILYAETAGNYVGTITEGDPTSAPVSVDGNELVGVTTETAVPWTANSKYNYILQGGVFKKATGDKLKAGKAYLSTTYDVTATATSPVGARELQIVIDSETTGIADIRSQKEEGGFFNLSGQRVTKPTKGLYIINGKKMIVK